MCYRRKNLESLKMLTLEFKAYAKPNQFQARTGEQKLKRSQRRVSKKVKYSSNIRKARTKLGKVHLKISRQRKDHAVKLARCVVQSNDLIA